MRGGLRARRRQAVSTVVGLLVLPLSFVQVLVGASAWGLIQRIDLGGDLPAVAAAREREASDQPRLANSTARERARDRAAPPQRKSAGAPPSVSRRVSIASSAVPPARSQRVRAETDQAASRDTPLGDGGRRSTGRAVRAAPRTRPRTQPTRRSGAPRPPARPDVAVVAPAASPPAGPPPPPPATQQPPPPARPPLARPPAPPPPPPSPPPPPPSPPPPPPSPPTPPPPTAAGANPNGKVPPGQAKPPGSPATPPRKQRP